MNSHRKHFSTSRAIEFFTEKELSMQIGTSRQRWAITVVKELLDNAIDACEGGRINPEIAITTDDDTITIIDNGPGIPASVIEKSLDYSIRVSDKNYYIGPTRGQLGNALKCIWAAPFVLAGAGHFIVESQGERHTITISLDRISQEPVIDHEVEDALIQNGTFFQIHSAELTSQLSADCLFFYGLVLKYVAFNPHLSISINDESFKAINRDWKKWNPADGLSPHWYQPDQLRSYIAAHLTEEQRGGRQETIRSFIGTFKGLTRTPKQKVVMDAAGMSEMRYLSELVKGDDVDLTSVNRLLVAMRDHTKTVKPVGLGVIGKDSLSKLMRDVRPDSFQYACRKGFSGGLPFVLEAAFGIFEEDRYREAHCGLNCSAALTTPFDELSIVLSENRVDSYDPVCVVAHLTCPHLDFTDRGKSRLSLPDEISTGLESAIKSVTKKWLVMKRRSDREGRVSRRVIKSLSVDKTTVRAAAFSVMEVAYMRASDSGELPVNARQVMYKARPMVIALTGNSDPFPKGGKYFTQTLLRDFLEDNPELTADWDILYDARGSFHEPHISKTVPIGTIAVREYIKTWSDCYVKENVGVNLEKSVCISGPSGNYGAVLFCEKEGFNQIFQASGLLKRFDLALMSTKGQSVTACRTLVEYFTEQGIRTYILRDFDKAGFNIANGLQYSNQTYQYSTKPDAIDLGLRLRDVEELELDPEPCVYKQKINPYFDLNSCGATDAEIGFLVIERTGRRHWKGQRVELNAMTSRQLVNWIEIKLIADGVEKVVPDNEILSQAYKKYAKVALIQKTIDKALEKALSEYNTNGLKVPDDLKSIVQHSIDGTGKTWSDAVEEIFHRNL